MPYDKNYLNMFWQSGLVGLGLVELRVCARPLSPLGVLLGLSLVS